MKTFNDLVFEKHRAWDLPNQQAIIYFDNGFGVSVLFGEKFYSNGKDNYELAILRNDDLCYDTYLTDDVLGGISAEEITEIMKKVQEFPKDDLKFLQFNLLKIFENSDSSDEQADAICKTIKKYLEIANNRTEFLLEMRDKIISELENYE